MYNDVPNDAKINISRNKPKTRDPTVALTTNKIFTEFLAMNTNSKIFTSYNRII